MNTTGEAPGVNAYGQIIHRLRLVHEDAIAKLPVETRLAVLGIAQLALMEQVASTIGLQRHTGAKGVEAIEQACRASVYWPEFCRAAKSNEVPEDFAGPGILSKVVLGWAQKEAA